MTIKKEFFGADLEGALLKAENTIGIKRDSFSYHVVKDLSGRQLKQPKTGIIVEFNDEIKKPDENWRNDLPKPGLDSTEKAIYVLEGIFKRMGTNVSIISSEKNGEVILTVKMLEGTIDLTRGDSREFRGAVQYIINRIFTTAPENELRIIVDIGGTLEERSKQLTEMAHEVFAKVKDIGKPINIHLMNSQDRRILHLALAENSLVSTSSCGEDHFRIIKIQPSDTISNKTPSTN